jgi:chloramphenicol 3-O phosphotransferase
MIILLNGASSAGKSSIAKELQIVFEDLFLGMSVDKFLSMVPSNYQGFGVNAAQMWRWEKSFDDYGELMTLKVGPRGQSYVLGMYDCVKVMAERGFNVIVDDVCLDPELLKQCVAKLRVFKIYFIGVTCQLNVLEERERLRGNRVINSARGQHGVVHRSYEYDLMVDTSQTSACDCALQIKAFVEKNPEPQAFKRFGHQNVKSK